MWPKVRGHVNDIKHKSTKKNKTEGPAISPADTLKAIEVLIQLWLGLLKMDPSRKALSLEHVYGFSRRSEKDMAR